MTHIHMWHDTLICDTLICVTRFAHVTWLTYCGHQPHICITHPYLPTYTHTWFDTHTHLNPNTILRLKSHNSHVWLRSQIWLLSHITHNECVVKSHNSHGSCATSEVRLLKCDFWSATSEVRLPKCDFWSRTTPVGVVWLQSDFWVISHIWMCRVMTHDSSPVTHTRRSEQSTVPQSHRTHTSGFWVISHIWTSRVITHVSSLMTHTRRSEQSTVALVTELTRLAYELLSQYYIWMSHVMTHDVVSYGVATISRLLRMIGLFCKGAL